MNFDNEDTNVYVIVKNHSYEDEEVIQEVVGWETMLNVINPLCKKDPDNIYEAFLKEVYYEL